MSEKQVTRRKLVRDGATAAAGITVGLQMTGCSKKEEEEKPAAKPPAVPESKILSYNRNMEYSRLGRTNFMCSRAVAGWIRNESLWRRLLASGINYFDNALGYGKYEVQISKFFQKNRDKIWITSKATNLVGFQIIHKDVEKLYRKAMKDFLGDDSGELFDLYTKAIEKEKTTGKKPDLRPAGKSIAGIYLEKLDKSLERMGIENVDCYMLHGIEIPWVFDCHEVWEAYEKAHKDGKIKHFGYSVHGSHVKEVLAAGVQANEKGPWKIDLIMPAVNPGSFDLYKPELQAYKKQDVGIIAMKTKGLAGRPVDGREQKLKSLTGGKDYNEYERAKLWMFHLTENLVDAVIMGIKSTEEMEKDLALPMVTLSTEAKRELRTIVKMEMGGTCHICGKCSSVCPQHIALTDMIRYHAYIHQYDEKEMARELYKIAGYDPATICTKCGQCEEACTADVPITRLLNQLSDELA
ncbi:MAG: aldo/keto reductase [Planctomycetota bacterium]|jgi:predicted aldo/keto reductase-like oxidoreductase